MGSATEACSAASAKSTCAKIDGSSAHTISPTPPYPLAIEQVRVRQIHLLDGGAKLGVPGLDGAEAAGSQQLGIAPAESQREG